MAERVDYFSRKFEKKLKLEELIAESATVEKFLKRVLEVVANEFPARVASVYLWDDGEKKLLLTATYGLNAELERKVKLKMGEGLVGHTMKTHKPLLLAKASADPLFLPIDGLGEERYDAYMVVPVEFSGDKIGVMVLQRETENAFTENELKAFKEIGAQVMKHLKSAGLLLSLRGSGTTSEEVDIEDGSLEVGFSDAEDMYGVAGTIDSDEYTAQVKHRLLHRKLRKHMQQQYVFIAKKATTATTLATQGEGVIRSKHVSLSDFDTFLGKTVLVEADFVRAVKKTTEQIRKLQLSLSEHLSEWAHNIFVGHLLILKDEAYTGKIRRRIEEGIAPTIAVTRVTRAYMRFFSKSNIPSIREKAQDIKDLGLRLLKNLTTAEAEQDLEENIKGKILITRDLYPSELMFLKYQGAKAVVQVSSINVLTSHMSLIAGSLKLPFMITQDESILRAPSREKVLLDFENERIYVCPARDLLRTCMARERTRVKEERIDPKRIKTPTYTQDGVRIKVLANINLLEETRELKKWGTDGIGLYRSEFPFMVRNTFPSENEQYHLYKRIISASGGKEVAIRTLDVGGDKILPYVSDHQFNTNSILGLRAIRFTLKYREVFIDQLKAILRAAVGMRVKIILPLISSLEEVREAKLVLAEAKKRLDHLGELYTEEYSLGIMVEVPSVVWILDELADEVDFFCIGTNDLVQYLLAVDRNNDMVANFYSHYHPSVLRMIKAVITAAERNEIQCTLCGQMGEDLQMIPFLLGVGLKRFSVSLANYGSTCSAIEQYSTHQATIIANQLLNASHVRETEKILQENLLA
ncbi:phosphoenolpyruvate-protein phosphotransferase [Spirochaetota bacterium]|nr:phosphoenolpyruvate-protein phosphotransferase [Spirochaetota bacterium]